MDHAKCIFILFNRVSLFCFIGSYSRLLRISRFAVINLPSSVYVIGGYCDDKSISRISNATNTWLEVGNLKRARFEHRSITTNDRVYVVGGYNTYLYVFTSLLWSSNSNLKLSETEILTLIGFRSYFCYHTFVKFKRCVMENSFQFYYGALFMADSNMKGFHQFRWFFFWNCFI